MSSQTQTLTTIRSPLPHPSAEPLPAPSPPPQNVYSQIYNTFLSRYSNNPPAGWESSCSWTAAAVGCQQNYGEGSSKEVHVHVHAVVCRTSKRL